jgi:hypothetical protein
MLKKYQCTIKMHIEKRGMLYEGDEQRELNDLIPTKIST